MKKLMVLCMASLIAVVFVLAGCDNEVQPYDASAQAEQTGETTPEVEPEAMPEAEPEAMPEVKSAPETAPVSEPEYEIVLKDPPFDFEYTMDPRYTYLNWNAEIPPVIFEDGNDLTEPPLSDYMLAFGLPNFRLYHYYDSESKLQLRAYGEKHEILYRENADGTQTKFISVEPVEDGLYKVLPELVTADGTEQMLYTAQGLTPVNIADEDFPDAKSGNAAGETDAADTGAYNTDIGNDDPSSDDNG
jgi:hypothetical protein